MEVTRPVLSWQLQLAVFFIAVAAIILRKPDVLTNAQFYAEDGAVWYADAYNVGWFHALLITAGGYFNSLQRLVAALALLVPLARAPLFMNCAGIVIQALPVSLLLSRRCSHWWPIRVRVLQAAIYLAIPNSSEIQVVLTNAPFHFALLAFLVATAEPPVHLGWKIFDVLVLSISALSGPFGIILLPLLLIFWWLRRESWSLVGIVILAVLSVLQLIALLFGGLSNRPSSPLGATSMMLFRLVAGHVYLGAIWGSNGFAAHARPASVLIIMLLGSSVIVYTFLKSRLELKLLIALSILLLAASLGKPLIAGQLPQWQLLAIVRGGRYWFFPMIAFLWSLLWCANQQRSKLFQMLGLVGLVSMLHGIVRDGRYPAFADVHFQKFVEVFNAAAPGTALIAPEVPAGFVMRLKKH